MQFRPAAAAALLIAMALSGCAGEEAAPFEPANDVAEPQPMDGNETLENTTEVVSLFESFAANVTGMTAFFFGNGTDANATWAIDADGNGTDLNGTGLPFVANFTYVEGGNYTVNLTVMSQGIETVATLNLSIEAVVEAIPDPIVFTGSAMIPDPYYAATHWECAGAIFSDGSSGHRHNFDIAVSGSWIYHLDADGFTTLWTGPDSYQETDGGALGVIPANTNRVYTCSEDAIDTEYTLTFYHPLHPDAPTV